MAKTYCSLVSRVSIQILNSADILTKRMCFKIDRASNYCELTYLKAVLTLLSWLP